MGAMGAHKMHASATARGATEEVKGAGLPILKSIVRLLIDDRENRHCLLAVCPNSEAVARAALLAAREANAPILFAATLNQVDIEGGYTGWTPQTLVDFLHAEAERIRLDSLVLPCLDHGGPWLKDQHTVEGYTYDETMASVKRSLEACIDAGYALLHIDPTVDRTLPAGVPLSTDQVIERTLEMIQHAEAYRQLYNRPPIAYEVGTEEVHGGLANMDNFRAFVSGLNTGLRTLELEDAWPCFIVGKVGTDLHTDYFDPEMARQLTEQVKPYGALIKGHYTDYVTNPEDYARSGMGGANVGPEYTEVEYRALMDLVKLEHKVGADSGLERALRHAVVRSGRWKKWLREEEKGKSFNALDEARQEWLVRTGCRYIWTMPEVAEARQQLYHNLRDCRNADAYVLWRIKTSIMKYFHAFNLIDFNDKIR